MDLVDAVDLCGVHVVELEQEAEVPLPLGAAVRRQADLQIPHTLGEARSRGLLPSSDALADDQLPALAEAATRDASLGTNPKPCSAREIEQVIRAALAG